MEGPTAQPERSRAHRSSALNAIRWVAIDSVAWAALSGVIGAAAGLVPIAWLQVDSVITRIRPWEHDGRMYVRLVHIDRWKRRLPEVSNWGPGERTSKASLRGRGSLGPLLAETRRAEYVHLALLCCGPVFWLWNPRWLAIVMTGFGVAFNLPFIAIQRYNRARILRTFGRRRGSPVIESRSS